MARRGGAALTLANGSLAKDARISMDKGGRFFMSVVYEIEATPPTAKPAEQQGGRGGAGRPRAGDGLLAGGRGGRPPRRVGGRREGPRLPRVRAARPRGRAARGAPAPAQTPSKERRALLREQVARVKAEREPIRADAPLSEAQRKAVLRALRRRIEALVRVRYRTADGGQADTLDAVRVAAAAGGDLRPRGTSSWRRTARSRWT